MTTTRIVPSFDTPPQEATEFASKPKEETTDIKALRDSLETKRQLFSLLEKVGHLKKDPNTIKAIDQAIADLDEIIEAFPDENFQVKV